MQSDYIISIAEGFRDCRTGDSRHKMIVRLYNQIDPLPRRYRLKETDAWCAAFVSACSYVVGMLDVVKPECGAHEMFMSYPGEQRHYDGAGAKRGDLLFFDWNGDRRIDHVGFVLDALEGSRTVLVTLEGNTDGKVDSRSIYADDPVIFGYVRPAYADGDYTFRFVDCDVLNLRSGPSMDAEIVAELPYAERVEVDGEMEGWAHTRWEKMTGYCGASWLSDTCPPLTGETTTAVYLRKGPGSDTKILKVLPAGTIVHYTGDREVVASTIWERVYVDEKEDLEGWVAGRYIRDCDGVQ